MANRSIHAGGVRAEHGDHLAPGSGSSLAIGTPSLAGETLSRNVGDTATSAPAGGNRPASFEILQPTRWNGPVSARTLGDRRRLHVARCRCCGCGDVVSTFGPFGAGWFSKRESTTGTNRANARR